MCNVKCNVITIIKNSPKLNRPRLLSLNYIIRNY